MAYGANGNQIIKIDNKELRNRIEGVASKTLNSVFGHNKFAGHRGTGYAPENTMAAFRTAKRMGFNVIETDVLFTSDGEPIIFHDYEVDRMTDGTGAVSALTLAEIKAMNIDAGTNLSHFPAQTIPTLEELLNWMKKNNMYLLLELKDSFTTAEVQKIYDLLKKYNMAHKTIVISFVVGSLTELKNIDRTIPVGLVLNGDVTQADVDTAVSNGFHGLGPARASLTQTGVDLAHDNGLFVTVWGVNTLSQAQSVMSLNVDYVTSDYISEAIYNGTV